MCGVCLCVIRFLFVVCIFYEFFFGFVSGILGVCCLCLCVCVIGVCS